jgi:hypothetical protein
MFRYQSLVLQVIWHQLSEKGKRIFKEIFALIGLDQGFPTWGMHPPGGTQEVSIQLYLGYICISGGTQLMLGGTQTQKGWEPLF